MPQNSEYPSGPKKQEKGFFLKRLWGWLPSLFVVSLIVVAMLLMSNIISEGKSIKEEQKKARTKPAELVNVVTLAVQPASLKDRLRLPGKTEAWTRLTLLTEVSGKVVRKLVETGQKVAQGAILAHLDPRDYQNRYNSAKASYDTALTSLQRLQRLYKEKLAPRSQVDNAQAQMESSKAAMEMATLALDRCKIRAPFKGIVNRVDIEPGKFLNVGDPVVEIVQFDRIKVVVGIPESDVEAVRRLNTFNVTIDALKGKTFTAHKHFQSFTAGAGARLYNLELALDNPRHDILPDMFVRVDIVKQTVAQGLAVPLYAIINNGQHHELFVANADNMVERRKVELGFLEGWQVQIKSGLNPGERVIIVGQRSINGGQYVHVVREVTDAGEVVL